MVASTTFSGSKMLVLIGDGATPTEVFTAPCGLTTKGLNRSAETSESTTPDCTDPSLPVWTEREVVSLSWDASGAGVLASESVAMWDTWFKSGQPKNIRIEVYSGPNAGRKYSGAALLTQFNLTGERGNKVTVDTTLSGTGALSEAAIAA